MFLNRQINTWVTKFNKRLAAIFTLGFAASILIVFTLVYWQIHSAFEAQDKRYLDAKLNEFSHRIDIRGVVDFTEYINSGLGYDEENELYIRLYSAQGNLLFEHNLIENVVLEEQKIQNVLEQTDRHLRYYSFVLPDASHKEILVGSVSLRGGEKLLLGRYARYSNAQLSSIHFVFWVALLPVALVGFLVSYYACYKVMKPFQEVTDVLRRIERGDLSQRMQFSSKREDLQEFKRLFNQIIDRVEQNIGSLRDAFDHLAHDIRTPVTRLRGRAELALEAEPSADAYREALQSCYENSDRILRFLETLTQITEAENRSIKLKRERRSVSLVINEILDLYEIAFEEKNILLTKNLCGDDEIDIDVNLIKRVIANLLDNAHKYNSEGAEVRVSTEHSNKYLLINITDNGPGIARSEQELIWGRLYRADKSRSTYGMGLGLTFVKAIVEAHGGEVALISPVNQDRGACFQIKFLKPGYRTQALR